MNLGQQILFFFSMLGAFNGFVISGYLLFFKKPKSPASYFLGLLLLALSIRITKAIFGYFFHGLPRTYLQIGLSGCFLIGPSLYYFTRAALSNIQFTPKRWKYTYWGWIVAIVGVGLVLPYETHPWDWNHYIVHIIYAQWVVYFFLTGWTLRKTIAKLFDNTQKLSPGEKPILSIFIGNMVILIAYVIVFFWSFSSVYIAGALFFSLLLYLNIPIFLGRKKSDTAFLGNEEPERYANKKIDGDHASSLTDRLHKAINEQELYKNPDLKLNDLAQKVNISAHQLSQLLNDNLGKSFASYINEYRIARACELISADKGIKLEEIGYEVGFNSKSTFYTAFKKHRGTTPTLYKENFSIATSL
ncbi:helix-turn-helix domain-containing protein [Pedobacter duraquae]|uniref:AraC family transcriptional regulator n=1 Tax=Pedobacter duraquae TaxID=425511 RepID=A0A4R6IPT9_9SPHI|nr:helix-turn-helix domain-containing protein [Pedobacter duraquae]TDO24181.1 AraC family transcriptional regulator [Pedobacter duraquae]